LAGAALVAGTAFAALISSTATSFVNDTYFNLVSGRWIAEHGLPRTDTLTVAGAGRAWTDAQWLAHLVFYEAWRLGGDPMVAAVTAGAVALSFAILYATMLMRGVAPARAVLWTLGAVFLVVPNSTPRAQTLCFPLFAGLVYLIARQVGRRWSPVDLGVLGLLIVWANLHGSVMLGIGIAVIWSSLRAARLARRGLVRDARLVLLTVPIVPLCVFATPYPPAAVLTYYRSIIRNPVIATYSAEWQHAQAGGVSVFFWITVAGAALVVGVAALRGRVVPPRFPLAMTVILVPLGVLAIRYQVWAAFPIALLCAEVAERAAPAEAGDDRLSRMMVPVGTAILVIAGVGAAAGASVPALLGMVLAGGLLTAAAWTSDAVGRRTRAAAVAALAVCVAIATVQVTAKPAQAFSSRVSPSAVDVAAAYMDDHPGTIALADELTAPQLLWQHPELAGRVGFDTRFEIYRQPALRRYFRWVTGAPNWQLELAGQQVVVLSPSQNPGLADRMTGVPGWRVIARDAHGLVLVRTG
jgi:hypothetical protein